MVKNTKRYGHQKRYTLFFRQKKVGRSLKDLKHQNVFPAPLVPKTRVDNTFSVSSAFGDPALTYDLITNKLHQLGSLVWS